MKESDYYPDGAYNDPAAPWNETEPEYRDEEIPVNLYCTVKSFVSAPVSVRHVDECDDGCGYEEWAERRDDWREVAREYISAPDMRWHDITERPRYGAWVVVKRYDNKECKFSYDAVEYMGELTFRGHRAENLVGVSTYQWQYVNEGDCEITIDDFEFEEV